MQINKNKLFLLSIVLAFTLSLWMGISDLFHISNCISNSCVKVHESTFGNIFGVPLGFWAALLFIFVFVAHVTGQNRLAVLILSIMLGVELYFTFIAVWLYCVICFPCFCFLILLLLAFCLKNNTRSAQSFLIPCLFFFIAHFAFFYPNAFLKPTILKPLHNNTTIEIFGSLSCKHCEKALSDLKSICSAYNADLIFRPVSLNSKDKNKNLQWICTKVFEEKTLTAMRMSEQILLKNESEIKRLEKNGNIKVPIILVKSQILKKSKMIEGWDQHAKYALLNYLDNRKSIIIGNEQNMCSQSCNDI